MKSYRQMISNPVPDLTSQVDLEEIGLSRTSCDIPQEHEGRPPAEQQMKDALWEYRYWIAGGILAGFIILGRRRQ